MEDFLQDVEFMLADGRRSILGDAETTYVDISFAAISSLWVQPPEFSAGRVAGARIDPADFPAQMKADVERWRERFPLSVALIERLYREERISV
jgi:hypothetical protein